MRRWFLILLIALLPLRVWVGDVMAGQMLAQQVFAINSVAHDAETIRPAADFDTEPQPVAHAECPGHAAMAAAPEAAPIATPAAGQATADCANCTTCQVCHSVALALEAPVAASLSALSAPPRTAIAHLTSADAAPGFKPPIS